MLFKVCTGYGLFRCSAARVEAYGRKTTTFFFFFWYLTNHLSFGAQWASERTQGFIADFCYSRIFMLIMLSRRRISELSKIEYLYRMWSGCLRCYCPASGLQDASLRPASFPCRRWDQLFRQQMLTEELGCATSFLSAPTKDVGRLWAWERAGSCFWQQQFWDWIFISTSSNPLLRFHIKVCFWQCGCIWLFSSLLPHLSSYCCMGGLFLY